MSCVCHSMANLRALENIPSQRCSRAARAACPGLRPRFINLDTRYSSFTAASSVSSTAVLKRSAFICSLASALSFSQSSLTCCFNASDSASARPLSASACPHSASTRARSASVSCASAYASCPRLRAASPLSPSAPWQRA
eukprot:6180485-Pleurochrysis_carterae.AAC.9